ncbi:MAG: glycosyltransferase family 39 protein [Chloroflexi bacterium]|nr:glycosyltransferase family 39 protein [Chloroflexota bacterium]
MVKTHVSQQEHDQSSTFFGRSRWLLSITVLVILTLGIFFRLMRLTNPPLDVHGWRWLRSAITARGFYYEMSPNADPESRHQAIWIAESFTYLEPPITEGIVALSYWVAGGEYLWLSRIWTTLFWTIGGLALFLLAKRITSADGAVVALAYYMLLPYGNTETRAFLPEPLMVMFILLALYAAHRWVESSSWKWAVTTGVLAGMAILTKIFAIFPTSMAILLVCIESYGLRRMVKNPQVWLVALLSVLIPASYYVFPNFSAGSDYLGIWSLPYLQRLADITFYMGWLHTINTYFNLAVALIAVASMLLLEKRWRGLVLGLWIGYGLFGLSFPSLIWSHIYYNLPLVGITALSLAPAGKLLLAKIARQGFFWQILFTGVALVAVGYSIFMSRKAVVAYDFSAESQKWQDLGARLTGSSIIGLTDDYNMRMAYYGGKVIYPYMHYYDWKMAEMGGNEFDVTAENQEYFLDSVEGMEYFVITLFDEFERQPYLKNILYNQYPILMQSDWYIVFDLRHPLETTP